MDVGTLQVVPLREMTMEEVAEGDGKDPAKPIYIAIRGVVYDVSTGRQFYGPDGGWAAAVAGGVIRPAAACCTGGVVGVACT
jgi:predicted heme/steroid binding protein